MVFVYRGAGKKQGKDADPCQKNQRCQKLACDIQWCLSRNNYNQKRCENQVKAWNDCCERVREKLERSFNQTESISASDKAHP
mmetsp:Transcript_11811/g.13615  ORF Transcript_11811/g.13615 Transcript_11811/m.13615 type:complete len:83 (-) Transcript_11811:1858-2106(-)